MKKYVLIGLVTGVALSLVLFFLKKNKGADSEFFDSLGVADDLFGNAFQDIPDKM